MQKPSAETTRSRHTEATGTAPPPASRLPLLWLSLLKSSGLLVTCWLSLLALITLALVLSVAGTPAYLSWISTLCTACVDERVTLAKLQALHALHISLTTYAVYWTTVNLVFTGIYCAVAVFLCWRKPGDRMVLLTAFFLIAQGSSFSDIPNALATISPAWHLPVALLDTLGLPSLTVFVLLFPTGHFEPRWTRWVALGFAVLYLPGPFFPGSVLSFSYWPRLLTLPLLLAWLGTLLFAQIYRYRRVSTPEARQQTRWVVFGAAIALLGLLLLAFLPLAVLPLFFPLQRLPLLLTVSLLTGVYLVLLLIPLALAVAVLRYRLWDIDVLIHRTLVYGGLSASVIALYVVVVVALGTALQAEGNLWLSLFATGLIAVLFQPLRVRLQRGVNRLMYGQRDDPYAVIARLSQRLKEQLSADRMLLAIVETVAQALRLPYVAIWWQEEKTFAPAASYGHRPAELVSLPLIYQGETIGQLQLAPRTPGEAFTSADQRLLDELARQAGLVAHTVHLATDLQQARERLVLAREEERRRLRRDLHDGVGPTLASVSQRIDTAAHLVARDPEAAIVQLGTLKVQLKAAIADLRRVVYTLRPPILDELGLMSALQEQVILLQEAQDLHVTVEAPEELPELSAAVEVAAYRIILEALTNVSRHAHAHHCLVHLSCLDAASLSLSIVDDGCGLPEAYHAGVGITSMRERAAELGGECTITSRSGSGTRVQVRLPLK